jgi:hypothetical protein
LTGSRLGLALVAVVAIACALAPDAGARTVRVHAMQPKLDLAWMESRQSYHDKMLALADARLRTPAAPAIQDGADDLASHLLGPDDPARPVATARDLVAWPEDMGLFAALTGPRAASARGSGSFVGAIVSLLGAYSPQSAYYEQQFPAVATRPLPVRLGLLGMTDTFARTGVETFAEIADRYDVYLEVGVNMAQDWKVVCVDREGFNAASPPRLPGGVRCEEQSPQKVVQLGDPSEPTRDYAYEATTDRVSNMALVFDPDGRLISKQVKTYLTPLELPGQLDLVPGQVSGGLSALETPVGTLGFVTSKDAWMPDVQAKLDEQHVDLLVQPEFFVNDLVNGEGMWAPDTLKASGYNDVLRLPSVKALVLPELTGNIFEFSADAQSHFAVKPGRAKAPPGHLVGQPDAPGLIASPWVVTEPASPGETFAQRRARLAAAGAALRPGSGVACEQPSRPGPCENGHVEGVFRRDVTVAARPSLRRFRGRVKRTRFSRARAVARSRSPQRNAALAMRGRRGAIAWEEHRGAAGSRRDQVLLATTRDGGRRWSRARRPTGRPAGATDERWPAVAVGPGGRVTVAWTDGSSGTPRAYFARSAGGGGTRFSEPRPLDASAPASASQWRPALAQGPGDTVHAAWIDERERSADDDLPQAHVFYARIKGGAAGAGRKLDTSPPVTLAAKLDNAWAPRLAVRGRQVLVTWLDFQGYDWAVFSRRSVDGGGSFAPPVRVTDEREDDPATSADEQQEELADTPDVAIGRNRPLIAWTDWRKRDSAATRPHQQYDIFIATPGGPNGRVDPYGGRQVSTYAPSICSSKNDDALVAFQDASRGRSDIRVVRMRGGARRGRARLVNDGGARAGNAWRPRLACVGGRVVAAWEDERDRVPQLYFATSTVRQLR